MTSQNNIAQLSPSEKRDRILQLEAELELLYQSLPTSDESPITKYDKQIDQLKRQTTTIKAVGDSSSNLSLVHVIPDMVYVLDSEFNIVTANQAFAESIGISINEIRGHNLLKLIPTFKDTDFYSAFRTSMDDQQIRVAVAPFDYDHIKIDDWHWYEARIFPTEGGILVIVRDITRQRQADVQMLEYQLAGARMEMLDEIVQNLAHDFRTPLSILNTSLYLLEHYTDPEKQQKKLEAVKRQVSIFEKMIENIILLTQLDLYQPSDLSRYDLVEVVEVAAQTLQSQADAKHQELRLNLPYQSIYHQVNADHLIRAIANIIENAIFYTPDAGTIDVSLETNPAYIAKITVRDTGIGIEAENLPYIFDRFYRVNQARTVNEAGNGLGLSIAKQIIELHDGTIEIISNPDYGTEVIVII